jgi:hypothetical protein
MSVWSGITQVQHGGELGAWETELSLSNKKSPRRGASSHLEFSCPFISSRPPPSSQRRPPQRQAAGIKLVLLGFDHPLFLALGPAQWVVSSFPGLSGVSGPTAPRIKQLHAAARNRGRRARRRSSWRALCNTARLGLFGSHR